MNDIDVGMYIVFWYIYANDASRDDADNLKW